MAHGVSVNEVPTGVKPPVSISAGLPVYVGTSPLKVEASHLKPVICYTLAEFEATYGPLLSAFDKWTLHEAAKAHFELHNVGPIVCICVNDPDDADHVNTVTAERHVLDADGEAVLQIYGYDETEGVLLSTVVVKVGGVTMTVDIDYTADFDDDGHTVITRIAGGSIGAGATIDVDYSYFDPTGPTAADVIAAIDLVEQVYPLLRVVPGFILAPTWSQTATVAAKCQTVAHSINGVFRAIALVDLSTDVSDIPTYASAAAWKTTNGYNKIDEISCWPLVKNGTDVYHLSTLIACLAGATDSDHDDIPYASPSNKAITGTALVLDDGSEVVLTRPQANSLNSNGIVTALNGFNGWKSWGNRTAIYPGSTDPKDTFIPLRRMFSWIANTIILTTDAQVDEPGNLRLINSVVGTIGSFINGLIARGALVSGEIEFRSDENPTADLADGKIVFHLTLTPPSPAEDISFTVEYDPAALEALFE